MLVRTYVEPKRGLEMFVDTPVENISETELARLFSISKEWKVAEVKEEVGLFGAEMVIVTFEKY